MRKICNREMLGHVIDRVRAAKTVEKIGVVTSTLSPDDAIETFCLSEKVQCFRGSEADVLDRYYQAALNFGATTIIRITADCPLTDPKLIDAVVEKLLETKADYATNTDDYTFPQGLDVEVFSFNALKKAWSLAARPSEREHVTPFLMNDVETKKAFVYSTHLLEPDYHWSVDTEDDLARIIDIFSKLNGSTDWEKALAVSEADDKGALNEGYYRSLLAEEGEIPTIEIAVAVSEKILKDGINTLLILSGLDEKIRFTPVGFKFSDVEIENKFSAGEKRFRIQTRKGRQSAGSELVHEALRRYAGVIRSL